MCKDARQTFRTLLVAGLLGASMVAGTALTWGVACIGIRRVSGISCKRTGLSTAKMRVKAAGDAAIRYMIETPSCPRSIDELVLGHYLELEEAFDPWGSKLVMTCPGINDTFGADISSPGADRQLGTADDVKSWEM
jgi:hypothetical protein